VKNIFELLYSSASNLLTIITQKVLLNSFVLIICFEFFSVIFTMEEADSRSMVTRKMVNDQRSEILNKVFSNPLVIYFKTTIK